MRNGAVLWGNMAQRITRPKAFQRKSTQRRASLLSAASNLHSHKNGRKVENSAGSSCDDYRWEWMIQPSRNTPTISQTERNNNGSVWFMQPDEDFQIHAKHAKKVVGRMQKISSMTGSQLGLNIYFYFFSSISCASAWLSGPKHPFHQAHTDKFEVQYQLAVRLFKRHSNICKTCFWIVAIKRGSKVQGDTSGLGMNVLFVNLL